MPNLVGGGFGIKGAAKGIAKATVFNLVRDGAESALVGSMNISGTQKAELYGRIRQDILFNTSSLVRFGFLNNILLILNSNGASATIIISKFFSKPYSKIMADSIITEDVPCFCAQAEKQVET